MIVLEFAECGCREDGFDELLGSMLVQVHVGSEGLRGCIQVGPASLSLEDHDVVMGMALQLMLRAHEDQFGKGEGERVDRAARRRAARRRAARSGGRSHG